jgi:hypothetical protein
MTKRRNDKTPDPPGGRAAERLRQFLDARLPRSARKKGGKSPKRPGPAGSSNHGGDK